MAKSVIVLQHASGIAEGWLSVTHDHHAKLCRRFGYEYRTCSSRTAPQRSPTWEKVRMIKEASVDFDYLIWLDADAIWIGEHNLNVASDTGSCFHAVRHPAQDNMPSHWNCGVLFIQCPGNSIETFCNQWWETSSYPYRQWGDQWPFNQLISSGHARCKELPLAFNSTETIANLRNSTGTTHVAAWHNGGQNRGEQMADFMRRYRL